MNALTIEEIVETLLERNEDEGLGSARSLYKQMFKNERLMKYQIDVNASLLLLGKDNLIIEEDEEKKVVEEY